MLILRLAGIFVLACTVCSLFAWMITGTAQYRRLAWLFFRLGLVVVGAILLLLVMERLLLIL